MGLGLLDYWFFENYVGQVLLLLLTPKPKALKYFCINHETKVANVFFLPLLKTCYYAYVGYDYALYYSLYI